MLCSIIIFCFCFDIQNNICTRHVVNLNFSENSMNNLSSYVVWLIQEWELLKKIYLYSVEVVAYLFSQKIIAPNKFHLLRGNHEHRRIQENFNFRQECVSKFGSGEEGERVWNAVNGKLSTKSVIYQLISKGLFGVVVSTKKPTDFFKGFLPWPLKRDRIRKIKALYSTN